MLVLLAFELIELIEHQFYQHVSNFVELIEHQFYQHALSNIDLVELSNS